MAKKKFKSRVIAFVSLKGGVGKTTSCWFFAGVALENGSTAKIIDADNEQSTLEWGAILENKPESLSFVAATARTLEKVAQPLANEVVLIDCPPNQREVLNVAAELADDIVLCVRPTGVDANRARSTLEVLAALDEKRVKAGKKALRVAVLVTHFQGNKKLHKEAFAALSEALPTFETPIRYLTMYEEAFGQIPKGKALEEYRAVWKELETA
jgi:cellulose biosynthesis protein BcsQ